MLLALAVSLAAHAGPMEDALRALEQVAEEAPPEPPAEVLPVASLCWRPAGDGVELAVERAPGAPVEALPDTAAPTVAEALASLPTSSVWWGRKPDAVQACPVPATMLVEPEPKQ